MGCDPGPGGVVEYLIGIPFDSFTGIFGQVKALGGLEGQVILIFPSKLLGNGQLLYQA